MNLIRDKIEGNANYMDTNAAAEREHEKKMTADALS